MKLRCAFLFVSVFLSCSVLIAQNPHWSELMNDPSVNFYDVQEAFKNDPQNQGAEKGKGWKQFKRWEYFWEPRLYPSGERIHNDAVFKEYQRLLSENLIPGNSSVRASNGSWTYVGNTSVPSSGGGAGRVNCIAFDPTNNLVVYVGTPAGGIWKTTNGGISWNTVTDQLPTLGVSSLAVDPSNSSVIYAGTGDHDANDTYSVGVLKSTDAGATWDTTGLNFTIQTGSTVSKILIDPTNSNTLIASTSAGTYRSTDAGATWNIVLSGNARDIEFKPDDPNIVYAIKSNSFYRSVNNGQSFSIVTNGFPSQSQVSRIAIAVTPADPNVVYALAGKSGSNGFKGVYKSTDAGLTWVLMADTPNLMGWENDGSDSGGQAWYDIAIAASPTNANLVFTGGVNIWKSTDGGSTWNITAHWTGSGAPYVHADIHALEFQNAGSFYAGCDGGIFRTTNNGNSWVDLSNNLEICQIYRLGTAETDIDKIIIGLQDNGTALRTAGNNWERVMGGDGMECIIDHTDDDVMYGEYYYGRIRKSTDGGNNFSTIVQSNGSGVDEEGPWVTPYIMHPANPDILLVGKSQVYKTTNGGGTWQTLGNIPGGNSLKFVHLAYAPSNTNVIYAIKRDAVFITTNGGNTWTNVSSNLPNAYITYITVSNTDPLKAWITFSGYSANYKVYYTNNGGVTWNNYTTGLPNVPANCIVYQNNTNDALYAGTDIGVYYRNSSMAQWEYFSNGLPNTVVNELEIHYPGNKIRAATYGRGVWESPVYSNIQNDLSVNAIHQPNGTECQPQFAPEITIRNTGDNTISTATIGYYLDANPVQYFNWSGWLSSGQSERIVLPSVSAANGSHTFTAFTLLPNGLTDTIPANDTLVVGFTFDSTAIPVTLNLSTGCFGSETGWNIKDSLNNTVYEILTGTYPGTITAPYTNGFSISENYCLYPGCYSFTITDTAGNGLSGTGSGCGVNGDYELLFADDSVAFENTLPDGNFGTDTSHNFCVTPLYYAAFSASPLSVCSGSSISFFDQSAPGTTGWNWNIYGPDTLVSSQQNPQFIFTGTGSYTVTLQTTNGTDTSVNTRATYITVNSTPLLSATLYHVLCNGDCTGKIVPVVTGGTVPFTFNWSDGSSADSLENLCIGNYSLILSDVKGCRDTISATITEPTLLVATASHTDADCGTTNGTANVVYSGGVAPYSVLWSTAGTTDTLTGLQIGTYTVTVTDSNGCVKTDYVQVLNPNAPVVDATFTSETCTGLCNGTVNATYLGGGTGTVTFNWDSLGSNLSYTGVCPGKYVFYAIDSLGCMGTDTADIEAGDDYPVASFVPNDTIFPTNFSLILVNTSTGANSYFWDFGDGATSTLSSATHQYTTEGIYTIMFIAYNGTCSDTLYFTVTVDDDAISVVETRPENIKIYPNPTEQYLVFDFGTMEADAVIRFYNLNGQLVLVKNSRKERLFHTDISPLAKGLYHIVIQADDFTLTRKVIIR